MITIHANTALTIFLREYQTFYILISFEFKTILWMSFSYLLDFHESDMLKENHPQLAVTAMWQKDFYKLKVSPATFNLCLIYYKYSA